MRQARRWVRSDLEQIKDELLNGRDLAKKGNRKRQLEYAERTARNAIEQL